MDSHGIVQFASIALGLAKDRADAAGNSGQGVVVYQQSRCFGHVALPDFAQVTRYIYACGAVG